MAIKSARIKALMESYSILYKTADGYKEMTVIGQMRMLVKSPAPSFFLSPQTVRNLIFAYERGNFLRQGLRRQMHDDIYNAYLTLKAGHPLECKERLIEMITGLPAPRYYINAYTAARCLFWPQRTRKKPSR